MAGPSGAWWCVWVGVLSEPFPGSHQLQSPEIKGAIAVLGTNKMVMAFPAACCFSWAPLLWSFGFLQLYRLGEKKGGKKCREGEQREPPEIYSPELWGRSFVLPCVISAGKAETFDYCFSISG